MGMHFMNGAGNSFVVVDELASLSHFLDLPTERKQAAMQATAAIYARGGRKQAADQVIVISRPQEDASQLPELRFYNTDGSQAEACGNGTRAALGWLIKHKQAYPPLPRTASIHVVEDDSRGRRRALTYRMLGDGGVAVDMGTVRFESPQDRLPAEITQMGVPGLVYCQLVNVGNPHLVLVVDSFPTDWQAIGARFETDRRVFPARGNVSFVVRQPDGCVDVRVWERGAGATLACGTAACAIHATLWQQGEATSQLAQHFLGGCLATELPASTLAADGHEFASIWLTGPIEYEGEYEGDFEAYKQIPITPKYTARKARDLETC